MAKSLAKGPKVCLKGRNKLTTNDCRISHTSLECGIFRGSNEIRSPCYTSVLVIVFVFQIIRYRSWLWCRVRTENIYGTLLISRNDNSGSADKPLIAATQISAELLQLVCVRACC
ncbi:uncharacterized protein EURHEDRAFT_193081 [Aspergillus ruber CBS 135680]|uniref:Uncharacterized protein n=1 Tax=Aspergillus ruber (strain CBS 135680) TaxID=1388766 RepID=A0A017S6C6_ASPRC|nr:uncharacterized protein EURHEDRAFT_193081 [Aspergillus ruber CBS 135680]EYE92411.1 hypothetical protein EURHEDRAFT_193081 [Aspergillus ruber CBS 135680]